MNPDELRDVREIYESLPEVVAPPVQQVIDRGHSVAAKRRIMGTGVGAVLAVGLVAIVLTTVSPMGEDSEVVGHAQDSQPTDENSPGTEQRGPDSEQRGFDIDIQKDGPLGGGAKLTLNELLSSTEEPLPVPPTTEETGERTGIWKAANQIGFVWSTDMRFYINPTDNETSTDQFHEIWEEKARNGDGVLTTVRGQVALGNESTSDSLASLTFIDNDFVLQFVSPSHSLDQLEEFAEAITYEDPENGGRFETESRSEEFTVEGTEAGNPWTLRVRIAEVTKSPDGTGAIIPCLGFDFGSEDRPGSACLIPIDLTDPNVKPFVAIEAQGTGGLQSGNNGYIGIAPDETETVELQHNEKTVLAELFDVPEDLGDFKLFVGFNSGAGAVKVVALDSDGNVLGSHNYSDAL